MDKRISVVMAACNGEKYIAEQLSSILSQLNDCDELIVSVDPSSDQTEQIVMSFNDPRITVLSGPGQGITKNFEHALNKVRGEYIFLSDQDDIWLPDKVEKMLKALDGDQTVLVLHDCAVADDKLNIIEPSYFHWHESDTGFIRNLMRNSFMGCCMGFHHNLLQYALPFPNDIPMHDQWLGLVATRKGKVKLLCKPLLLYRRHSQNGSSLQHSPVLTMIKNRYNLIKSIVKRI
ncbi:glycosyltransferase family 2 protein [Faecalibaculum rodentium]|uniref:glycosyltransferase family 2 protein n=1 Tax=Faecalibaculum rodentium TaxID=1702221 RepID=UPI0026752DCD|nr:glycosyltransferase family 2 protein [Faecalibaculum rodentium]